MKQTNNSSAQRKEEITQHIINGKNVYIYFFNNRTIVKKKHSKIQKLHTDCHYQSKSNEWNKQKTEEKNYNTGESER